MRNRTGPIAQMFGVPSGSRGFFLFLLLCAALAAILLILVLPDDARSAQSKVEAETMLLSGSKVVVHSSSAASGGQDVAFYANGSASKSFSGAASQVVLRARGTACSSSAREVWITSSRTTTSFPRPSSSSSPMMDSLEPWYRAGLPIET